jgi:hypothetical protein
MDTLPPLKLPPFALRGHSYLQCPQPQRPKLSIGATEGVRYYILKPFCPPPMLDLITATDASIVPDIKSSRLDICS